MRYHAYTRILVVLCAAAIGLNSSAAFAQDGPTLDATLSFIRDKLLAIGEVKIMSSSSDGQTNFSHWQKPYSTISYNGCTIIETHDGNASTRINLEKVTDITVTTGTDFLAKYAVTQGKTLGGEATPSSYILHIQFDGNNNDEEMFYDQSMADRVAKAFAHAAKLCGGLKPEAF